MNGSSPSVSRVNRTNCDIGFPRVGGKPGRPRQLPDVVYADRGYDSEAARRLPAWFGIEPRIAERGVPHGSGLGKVRWVVERTASWVKGLRRMRVRYDRLLVIRNDFATLAAAVVCFRILTTDTPHPEMGQGAAVWEIAVTPRRGDVRQWPGGFGPGDRRPGEGDSMRGSVRGWVGCGLVLAAVGLATPFVLRHVAGKGFPHFEPLPLAVAGVGAAVAGVVTGFTAPRATRPRLATAAIIGGPLVGVVLAGEGSG